jgi:FkbM family methyltransferase
MNVIDHVFSEPELQAAPPVLVDIGAAGGVHPAWKHIARYAIGVGFEPDAREAAPLNEAQRKFKQWIFCPAVAWPGEPPAGGARFHFTQSPQCSSVLRPDAEGLKPWAFAELFAVTTEQTVPAIRLAAALAQHGLSRVDWLKCDTQGLDLRLFQSLPEGTRRMTLAVEFEPGFIHAYEGEDRLGAVLAAMDGEPYWLAEFSVQRTARGEPVLFGAEFGADFLRQLRRFGPGAPGWANLRWLRDVRVQSEMLDRRAYLLSWVFSTLSGQHAEAFVIATHGQQRFGSACFDDLKSESRRRLRWSMRWRAPVVALQRLLSHWSR